MADQENEKQQAPESKDKKREPYEPPRLDRYGQLDEITQGGNPALTNDPGGNSTGKFPV